MLQPPQYGIITGCLVCFSLIMKLFKRFPRWLRFSGLATFVALCVGVNAIALVGISRSLQSRPPATTDPSKTAAIKISPLKKAASSSKQPTANTTNPAIKLGAKASTASRLAGNQQLAPVTDESLSKSPNSGFAKPTEPFISTANPSTPQSKIASKATPAAQPTSAQPKYGHFPYAAQDTSDMVQVASYPEGKRQRTEKMHPEAAKALLDMVAAARADGIWLVPASGFRTFAQQRTLFNAQVAKKGSPEAAAKISAPPGYSEHHTGYAIDLTDGTAPQAQDISPAFANTPAYQWLVNNAATHGFELSFPENNPQGISFEPWHWRYVGNPQAKATFGKKQPPETVSGGTERLLE